MKRLFSLGFAAAMAAGHSSAQGLFFVGSEAQESLPLRWIVGADLAYDDNVTPTVGKEDSVSFNPYAGLTFVNMTPQTSWDVYARVGLIYYFDSPEAMTGDTFAQSRIGVNLTHRFSERLRFASRNSIAYELEPDYSYGFATTRQVGEYFFWQADNSLGYRWSERVATYSGLRLTLLDYDSAVPNSDRFTWELYNQFRYQLSPQTVSTVDYRYSQTTGNGVTSDSYSHYILGGAEHRFSPTSIVIARAGAQIRDVDDGDSETTPFVELALRNQVTQDFNIRGFLRYSVESTDTVHSLPGVNAEFDERFSLRIGLTGEYVLSPTFSIFGGTDFVSTDFGSGRDVDTPGNQVPDQDETLFNTHIGISARINEFLTATASYNYTNSDASFVGRDYDRNRINLGLRSEF